MTFKDFKKTHLGGYNTLSSDEMQPYPDNLSHKVLYENCDSMTVIKWKFQPLNGVYTVFLR